MADPNDGNRSLLLDSLNRQANIPLDTADDYSIRAWITSAKKCFDQAEVDIRENDPEAAYVNYLRAVSIMVEIIPCHKRMWEIEEKRTVEAEDYWRFRNRISSTLDKVQRLKMQIRAKEAGIVRGPTPRLNARQDNDITLETNGTTSPNRPSSANGSNLKIPRKRPIISSFDSRSPSLSNGAPSKSSSISSSSYGPTRPSNHVSQSSDGRLSTEDSKSPTRQQTTFPKANVIEPSILLSYLTQPERSRPSILLLDIRPKDQYEKGYLNAENVVWIDPILVDDEKSGNALEESLVLCPIEQQDWFSNRHLFDLVIIYDEESRVNSYSGGPVLDVHQVRLRNLTVAIFDYAGYRKPLKHVPMLLVGGIRAWCSLVREYPLRKVTWTTNTVNRATEVSQRRHESMILANDVSSVERQVNELDLDAESQWLESLHSDRSKSPLTNLIAQKSTSKPDSSAGWC